MSSKSVMSFHDFGQLFLTIMKTQVMTSCSKSYQKVLKRPLVLTTESNRVEVVLFSVKAKP